MLNSKVLHKWYREFNEAVFQNELDRPVLVVGDCRLHEDGGPGCMGMCWGNRIMVHYTLNERDARSTLLHELVHYWQHKNGLDMDHGKTFEQWRHTCRFCTGLVI